MRSKSRSALRLHGRKCPDWNWADWRVCTSQVTDTHVTRTLTAKEAHKLNAVFWLIDRSISTKRPSQIFKINNNKTCSDAFPSAVCLELRYLWRSCTWPHPAGWTRRSPWCCYKSGSTGGDRSSGSDTVTSRHIGLRRRRAGGRDGGRKNTPPSPPPPAPFTPKKGLHNYPWSSGSSIMAAIRYIRYTNLIQLEQ